MNVVGFSGALSFPGGQNMGKFHTKTAPRKSFTGWGCRMGRTRSGRSFYLKILTFQEQFYPSKKREGEVGLSSGR